eukprot:scaffold5006_cov116-Isochrysis_galbana.AAC.3
MAGPGSTAACMPHSCLQMMQMGMDRWLSATMPYTPTENSVLWLLECCRCVWFARGAAQTVDF